MGNNPSSTRTAPQSPASHGTGSARHVSHRPSIQALSTNVKATTAPPSASLESAAAEHSHSGKPKTDARSRLSAAKQLKSQDKQLEPPSPLPTTTHPVSAPPPQDAMGNQASSEKRPEKEPEASQHPPSQPPPSPVTKPLNVPAHADGHIRFEALPTDPEAPSSLDQYQLPPSQYSRPPRLPLPIEEEVHTPGSPIISPADLTVPIEPGDEDAVLPRKTSVLSSTTVEDDDLADELRSTAGVRTTVPTLVEWRGGGEKVYVTGTFAMWDKKYRLHRNGPSEHKDALSTILHLTPGTHHIRFIVDGDMRLSDALPTAVDFTNYLVNYIEVSADDLPQPPGSSPLDIPGKQHAQQGQREYQVPPGIYPPQVLPPTPELQPVPPDAPPPPISEASEASKPAPVEQGPPKHYHQQIPRWLTDLDCPDEHHPRFQRAMRVLSTTPAPPTLPMFLTKSILNSSTPMKDDASVLVLPNHTVLNHLATSSIKNNVLATSATTRYKRKFLTTIMYKPTKETGD